MRTILDHPATIDEALENTIFLWSIIQATGQYKMEISKKVGMDKYYADCPLCQYTINKTGDLDCSICPLKDKWSDKENIILTFEDEFDIESDMEDAKEEQSFEDDICPCEKYDSPYYWFSGNKHIRRIAANMIVKLVITAMDERK
jgi:hypothetical protein